MMRTLTALLSIAALAACGADGEPIRPSLNAGVGVSTSGVSVGGNVGVSKGPITLNFGL